MPEHAPIKWTEKTANVADLKPYEKNPRNISDAQFDLLVKSLQEMGYHQRVLAQPDLRVIGGHQRIKAFKQLGWDTVTVLVPDRELSPSEFKKLLVQDNLPFGEFNFEMLQADFEFDDLKAWGLPADWLAKAKPPFDDDKAEETPALQAKIVSASRDVWLCGAHRVMCGDSTNAEDVAVLLGDDKPNLMVTDPPYNIGFKSQRHQTGYTEGNDSLSPDQYLDLLQGATLKVECNKIITCGMQNIQLWLRHFAVSGIGTWLARNKMSGGKISNLALTEPILFIGKFDRSSRANDIFEFNTSFQADADEHPCPKPLPLFREFISCYGNDALLYDPFLGSGTTMIAAEQTARKCFGLEISPNYVDVIVRRWQAFTGHQATLASTGETFSTIEKARG